MEKPILRKISNSFFAFIALLGLLLGLKETTNFKITDILIISSVIFVVILISIITNQTTKLEKNIFKIEERLNKFQEKIQRAEDLINIKSDINLLKKEIIKNKKWQKKRLLIQTMF